MARVDGRIRGALGLVNPVGWTVLAVGVAAAAVAATAGWLELGVLAAACLLLLLFALPLLLGTTRVGVVLVLDPQRVVAGDSVAGSLELTNLASGRLLPTMLELPVGAAVHRYACPRWPPAPRTRRRSPSAPSGAG